MMKQGNRTWIFMACLAVFIPEGFAQDWPMWGGDPSRNMASSQTNITTDFDPGKFVSGSGDIDLSTTKNVKWVANLGSESFGNVTISGGKVYIGTNNESPRDPKHEGDRGIVMCFEEKTGQFLWQLVVPKLGAGKVSDWEYLGICSSPLVEGDRVYVVTNRCEVVCLDANGLANGNDGSFQDEGQYMAGPNTPPLEPGATDADIIWRFDMRGELGVFPHNITSSSILVHGDRLYVTTSNGQDWSHLNIPQPMAPCLISLDKNTGELAGEEGSGIGPRIYHCNWSSPSFGQIGDREMVIFGAGDGRVYGFNPIAEADADGYLILPEYWHFDCIPDAYKRKDGKPIKYPAPEGPSEIIATPVFYKGRVYVGIGQDPEHGEGVGILNCIDVSGSGDITKTGKVWSYQGIERTISTVAILNDLVFAADYTGRLHCLDAETGEVYWVHDTKSHIWGSPLAVDGKVILGNEDGTLFVFAADKELKVLNEIEMSAPVYSTPVVSNGVLYISTQTHLFAIQGPQS